MISGKIKPSPQAIPKTSELYYNQLELTEDQEVYSNIRPFA